MTRKKKDFDPDEPRPLNFDDAEETGPSDHLKRPFMTREDVRGDNEDEQYYEEEEAVSPEEDELRKEEDEEDGD